ncbi:hypothetical protein H0I76_18370 [Limibaculum sp. M0105]|uniref:Flagellin n=1 Tax=Thermohalobaculum xanthum TaxID=2753746 RepID=A0A8J7MAE1_9RHOB|nr:hypothetical protein [Thermohalobaculum xanthum]MBK0401168.1 hypothetical protein [Thermohalobaculum xanthum]
MNGFQTGFFSQPRMTTLSRVIADLRERGDDAQSEAVTGRPADLAERLSGRVAETVTLSGAIDRLAAYNETIALTELRADIVSQSLGELRQIATDLANSAETAMASNLPEARSALSDTARAALERAVAALNLSAGGRSVFSGDEPDKTPLAAAAEFLSAGGALLAAAPTGALAHNGLLAGFSDPAGVFSGSLYTGGTGSSPRAAISAGEVVSLDVRADAPELREAMAHVVALAKAFDGSLPLDRAEADVLAERAIAGLRASAGDIAQLEARVGTIQERVATTKARNAVEEAGFAIALDELSRGDAVGAALRFNAIEGQIETLFATTARLSGISLGAFLR